jgi:general secretion pathway protein C
MRNRTLSLVRSLTWPVWLATALAFAAVCAVIAYWALQILAPRAPIAPSGIASDQRSLPQLQAASQLFGATVAATAAAPQPSNIQVVGIVAAGRLGSAILTVDGKPPKSFSVGTKVSPTQSLGAVRADAVVIDSAGQRVELPAPTRASLDVLTSGKARAASSSPPAAAGGLAAAPTPGASPMPAPMPMPMPAPGQDPQSGMAQPMLPAPVGGPVGLGATGGQVPVIGKPTND